MRQSRFISPFAEKESSIYHCVSRVVDRRFVLGAEEKDVFVRMMRQYEVFCGVQVLSYCIMSNHFHVLVEVPPKVKGQAVKMSDTVFLRKMKSMYSAVYYREIEQMLNLFRGLGESGDAASDVAAEELKAKYTSRMHDLSEFMKGLKQRFTQWYNGTHGRTGTLWEGRFKSQLVEDGYAARVMAAYIDLNPIRAAMVAKPEDYRWSSYGEAMQLAGKEGNKLARAGLSRVMGELDAFDQHRDKKQRAAILKKMASPETWKAETAARYRAILFSDGEETYSEDVESGLGPEKRLQSKVRKGFQRDEVAAVLARGGKLTMSEALRCRVRYFSDGMTLGSQEFVNRVFNSTRDRFGAKRKSGAKPLRGVAADQKKKLYSMRQLVKNVIT
ncbi:MAG: transposase [Akkermansiaceae bacterium]